MDQEDVQLIDEVVRRFWQSVIYSSQTIENQTSEARVLKNSQNITKEVEIFRDHSWPNIKEKLLKGSS